MKSKLKKLLRPFLFTVGGALAGLGYYYVVGCSTGSCAITSKSHHYDDLYGSYRTIALGTFRKGV